MSPSHSTSLLKTMLLPLSALALAILLPITTTLLEGTELFHFLTQYRFYALCLTFCAVTALLVRLQTRPFPLLLLDYTCFLPDHDRRASYEICEYFGRLTKRYSATSEEFMRLIYDKSGLGDETYGPPFIFQDDFDAKLVYAVQEAEESMFAAVDSLLAKTGVDPSQIDVVVVACSMFSPSPSLTSFLVKRYGFHPSVKTYNLSGMGCSAGTLGVDMIAKILRRKPGNALLVVTENTSLNWYFGDNRHMLVTNCIFRVGAAAVLLTSEASRRSAAKMELVMSMRTHHGADDAAYGAATQQEDEEGNLGVALTKDLVRVAGVGLKDHIKKLGPRVLPVSQLLRFAFRVAKTTGLAWWEERKRGAGEAAAAGEVAMMKDPKRAPRPLPLVPDFTTAFEHMCIHTGGKAVIDTVGRLMRFAREVTEPARMALHRFGNTSSSLVYYQLAYFEAKGRVRKGEKVWMLAFGTGFKACSVVWRALRDLGPGPDNPWNGCVHRYPVA